MSFPSSCKINTCDILVHANSIASSLCSNEATEQSINLDLLATHQLVYLSASMTMCSSLTSSSDCEKVLFSKSSAQTQTCSKTRSGIAARLVEVQEMVMSDDASFRSPAAVQLVERPSGLNTVGVVAWLLLLRTPECPEGRQVQHTCTSALCHEECRTQHSFACCISSFLCIGGLCCTFSKPSSTALTLEPVSSQTTLC